MIADTENATIEIIDLRTLQPWDRDLVATSVRKLDLELGNRLTGAARNI